uniref:C2H2-type domain-containing protein n=1 Tax=Glossina palpalis gambiensis TaxID=67801 RepID=A0A1B0BA65_9MUSC
MNSKGGMKEIYEKHMNSKGAQKRKQPHKNPREILNELKETDKKININNDKCIVYVFTPAGDKPHIWELCNKKFALACNLRAHLKTHEEQQDECVRCRKLYLAAVNAKHKRIYLRCFEPNKLIDVTGFQYDVELATEDDLSNDSNQLISTDGTKSECDKT